MKKILTFALAAAMTIASSVIAFAAEPIGAITNVYTFEGEDRSGKNCDTYVNPFKDAGLDVASLQYTVTISEDPKYLSGYDTVLTFGSSNDGFVYVCNELVGINKGGFADFWPAGEVGKMVYPGKGQNYTVNLVFTNDGVAFYLNGEKQPGSNVPMANAEGTPSDKTGADILALLNSEKTLYIGDKKTSYWATQNMTLTNIVFFNGEVTSPYTLTGDEPAVSHLSEDGKEETEAPTNEKADKDSSNDTNNSKVEVVEQGGSNTTIIIVIVIVVIVAVLGVAGFVIFSQRRR